MKLIHPLITQKFEFDSYQINVLVVENPEFMSELIQELKKQINGDEGRFVLSDDKKELSIKKNIILFTSPFEMDLNSSKIINKSCAIMKEHSLDDTLVLQRNELNSMIHKFLFELQDLAELELSFTDEIDISYLLKCLSPYYPTDNMSLLEKCISYFRHYSWLYQSNIFVLLNFKSYFTDEEMMALYKEMHYQDIDLLLIENKEYSKLDREKITIIDHDLCEI